MLNVLQSRLCIFFKAACVSIYILYHSSPLLAGVNLTSCFVSDRFQESPDSISLNERLLSFSRKSNWISLPVCRILVTTNLPQRNYLTLSTSSSRKIVIFVPVLLIPTRSVVGPNEFIYYTVNTPAQTSAVSLFLNTFLDHIKCCTRGNSSWKTHSFIGF